MSGKNGLIIIVTITFVWYFLMSMVIFSDSFIGSFLWAMVFCAFTSLMFLYALVKGKSGIVFFRPAPWKFLVSFVGLAIVTYSWTPDFSSLDVPYYQTPRQEDLHLVSGKLTLYNNSYGVDIGGRTIAIECPPTVLRGRRGRMARRSAYDSCFPENIESHLGKVVGAYLLKPLDKSEYRYDFYELKSGDDVLVSYDVIALKQQKAFAKTRVSVVRDTVGNGLRVSMFILCPILMWFLGMCWYLLRRKSVSS